MKALALFGAGYLGVGLLVALSARSKARDACVATNTLRAQQGLAPIGGCSSIGIDASTALLWPLHVVPGLTAK